MNKLIKELEQQCWEPTKYGPPWFNYEKFAELIVRECSAVANHFSDGYELDQFGRKLHHYTADIGHVIEGYFGVEE